ncbi:MAG TPA: S53 family peptidase [Bryobacteraceae bacterium]
MKAILALCFLWGLSLDAQPVSPRIVRTIDDNAVVRFTGSVRPALNGARDLGRIAATTPIERVLLILKASPEQDAALEKLLTDLSDPRSPQYQQWLTPEDFGEQFGPAQQDVDTIVKWLRDRGLSVNRVSKGRRTIEFSGTALQMETSFHSEIHSFEINGERHIANATELAIPEALSAVVGGVRSMHDFRLRPQHHIVDTIGTDSNQGGGVHAIAPYDFATIYNIAPLWNAGLDGSGQTIAIVSHTNVKLSDVADFRSRYGLPLNTPTVILDGPDPGIFDPSEELEADLDLEWAGAIAKRAAIQLVTAASTNSTDGLDLASQYIIDNNLASVMSLSYGSCESDLGASNSFYNTLWQQAAAQGISVFVSAGDDGSAGCDPPSTLNSHGINVTTPASGGFAVNGLASTAYNVAVGGTQFNDLASPSTYWNGANDSNQASALGYIPESAWNESSYSPGSGLNSLYAGAGGVSSVHATPGWQTGLGVPTSDPAAPNQHHRYLPDVAFTAAAHDGYIVEREGSVLTVSGTSAPAPSVAGLMAILNQYSGTRGGNPNPRLYSIAASAPTVFHDVTAGTNAVPCSGGSSNCSATAGSTGTMNGYNAGTGYDLATGWGSADGYALAQHWTGAAAYTGYLDSGTCQALSGWAADKSRLNQPILVSIYDGATLIGSLTANGSRSDVGAYLGDNGLHAFNFPLPSSIRTGGSHTFHVRFDNTLAELPASPVTLTCSSPSPSYEGWVDGSSCSAGIHGWAADLNGLGLSITVSLWYNGAQIASTIANGSRPDVGAVIGDNGLHGFSLPLPSKYLDGVSRNYSVHFENSTTALSAGTSIPLSCSIASLYAGYLDSGNCTAFSGWAANHGVLNQTFALDVVQGSTTLLTVLADLSRPDVGSYLGDNGIHGFSFATPLILKDGAPHVVNLRFSGTATSIGNAPQTIQCAAPVPPPAFAGSLDGVGCSAVSGWAADRSHLNTSIGVEFYDGATLVGSTAADTSRPDVGAYLGDNGIHGFSWTLPPVLRDGNSHVISARPAGSTGALPGTSSITCTQ